MTQTDAVRPISTFRRETGSYHPRRFNDLTRERFLRDRRQRYIRELPAAPTHDQTVRIDSMSRLEWQALKAEARNRARHDIHSNSRVSTVQSLEHEQTVVRAAYLGLGELERVQLLELLDLVFERRLDRLLDRGLVLAETSNALVRRYAVGDQALTGEVTLGASASSPGTLIPRGS